jgi:hypothetical protein
VVDVNRAIAMRSGAHAGIDELDAVITPEQNVAQLPHERCTSVMNLA